MSKDLSRHTYLGDAVYAEWLDHGGVDLRLNHHESQPLIRLESEALGALIAFRKRMLERRG